MKSSTVLRPTKTAAKSAKSRSDTWQAEKSQMTRNAILEATVQCLVEIGYAQTTTERIASQAGVSRGAMTHHFKSRAEVFNAAAKYITEKRAEEYERLIGGIDVPAGTLPTLKHMRETMVVCHRYYAAPTFIALHELLRGARTDKALKRAMAALEKSLDQKISNAMLKRFPYLAEIEDTREMLMDLIMSTMQGVAVDMAPHLKKGKRLDRLLDLLASIAMREFNDAYEAARSGKGRVRAAA
ncbi:MAG TPA: helix-turn-helix domain-containing protein [Noviherbaspirillum sp.]